MGHDDRSQVPFSVKFTDHLENRLAGSVVQVPGRLVGQKHLRLPDQGPGNGNPLLFAAGKLTNFMLQPVRKSYPVEHSACSRLYIGPLVAPDQLRHHCIFNSRKFRQKVMELKDKPDVLVPKSGQFLWTPVKDILVFKEHIPSRRRVQAAEQVE